MFDCSFVCFAWSFGVIKYDYLIPQSFVLWVASLVSSSFVWRPTFPHLQKKWKKYKDHPVQPSWGKQKLLKHGTSILSANYRSLQRQLKELKEKKELGKGKWIQVEIVGWVPIFPVLHLFLAGIPFLYSPYPDDYMTLVAFHFKATGCLPFIRLCTKSSHVISCDSCVEPAVHRVESVLPSVMVFLHHHFCQAHFQCILFSPIIILSILISPLHWRHLL